MNEDRAKGLEIRVADLTHIYPSGVQALKGVNLVIQAGESVAIIGQNGSGKTTLVKHFNGLLKPTTGSVLVGGWDTRERSVASLAVRVGYVFQNPDDQLFQSTVLAEVMFGPKNLGWEADQVRRMAEQALAQVGLEKVGNRHPYDLSPGDRRKVALAAVLAMDTPVIILDEPTTGQDFAGVRLIGEIVERVRAQGKTVITITHDIDFCSEHFERVIALAEGEVLLDGETRTVLAQGEILAKTYVQPPQLVRLAQQLDMARTPLSVEEFIRFGFPPDSQAP
jgi:energy-coupling factor transport system ATP-binding protein